MNSLKTVKKAAKGCRKSFEILIEEHKLTMYRVSRTILSDDQDSADAIQETILKAYEGISKLREPRFFKTWLIRILMNECNQIHRKRKNIIPIDHLWECAGEDRGYRELEVLELIHTLPDRDSQLLKLFYIDDLSMADLALLYETSENTIKTRLRRSREKLRSMITQNKEEELWINGKNN
ncbi:RNA polymerase subunit sigma-24 [Alteribacter lacisalsi]|uniref:RNA polymerase subunit sigma-24 n=1 Tax=Alteribacter lacisalsi TaxID=2045244 RepID=A0A2W0H6V2_9BACI|nr:sigma-70 family RNA polymerase sigma factor [Alteribacter lacisalsi]PYZ97593.1 RNA polymerase subunit sigma-24 [Alteribacter lacisalsi]